MSPRRWGNPKATTSVEQVRALRAGEAGASPLLTLARVGLGVGVLLLVAIALLLARRVRRRKPLP
jgi:hypothetical protein